MVARPCAIRTFQCWLWKWMIYNAGGFWTSAGTAQDHTTLVLKEEWPHSFNCQLNPSFAVFSFIPVDVTVCSFISFGFRFGDFRWFRFHVFFLANVYGNDFLRPPPLSQHSVKCRHHWACPMCLYGTLCWSGGWWGCWWPWPFWALLLSPGPPHLLFGALCLWGEITRS